MEFFNFAVAMIILILAWRSVVLLLSRPARPTAAVTSTPHPHRVRVASRRPSLRVRSTS
jgi:hypothetical protein